MKDDGSVAEWVLLVCLAVLLVAAVLIVASPAVQNLVESALNKITP